jgi:transposase
VASLTFHCHNDQSDFQRPAADLQKVYAKAECVRYVAAGARQTDVARAQSLLPVLLSRWQRQALAKPVPSSAERDEIKRLWAELRRVEQESGILKSCDHLLLAASVMSHY